MADYFIINGTAAELTNVNAGGSDVAAYSMSSAITLDATELAALLTNDKVAVMSNSNNEADQAIIDRVLRTDGYSDSNSETYDVANGTAAAITNVNLDGDDLPAYSFTESVPLDVTELQTLLANDGVMVMNDSTSDAAKHAGVKVLKLGKFPSAATS